MTAFWDLPDDIVSGIIANLDYFGSVKFMSTCRTAQQMCSTPEFMRLRARNILSMQFNFNCAEPVETEACSRIIDEQRDTDLSVYTHFKNLLAKSNSDFHLYSIVKHRLKALNVLQTICDRPKTLTEYSYSRWIISALYTLEVPADYHITNDELLQLRPLRYKYAYMLHRRLMWRTQSSEQQFFDLALKNLNSECLADDPKQTVEQTTAHVFGDIRVLMRNWLQTDSKCIAFCALSQLRLGEMGIKTEIKTKGYMFCLRTDFGCYFVNDYGQLAWIEESIVNWDSQEMTDMVLVTLQQCEDLSNVHLFESSSAVSSQFTLKMSHAYKNNNPLEFEESGSTKDELLPETTTSLNGVRVGQFVKFDPAMESSVGVVLQVNKYSARIVHTEGAINSVAYSHLRHTSPGELCDFHGLTIPAQTRNIAHVLGEYFTSYNPEWGVFV